ncbi:MAG: DedA family protein [Phycisphaerales bacterium]|nr:MAG: DedA family protein [Phycisphaerales bacterium]
MYDWVLHWADTPYGGPALFVMAFAESSFFPVPPDVLLAPLVLGNRRKWLGYALACSLASLVGGVFGYAIGYFAWQAVGGIFHDHVPGFSRDVVVLRDGTRIEGMIDSRGVKVALPLMRAELQFPDDSAEPLRITDSLGRAHALTEDTVVEYSVHPFTKAGGLYQTYDFWIVFIAGFTPLPYKVITITAGVFGINFPVFLIASAVSRSARFFLVAGLIGLCGDWIKPKIDRYFNLLCILFVVLLVGGFAVIRYL